MTMTGAVLQGLRGSDAYQYSVAHLAMNASDWNTTMHTIAGQCWPTYVSSQHLGLLQVGWPRADSYYIGVYAALLSAWVARLSLTSACAAQGLWELAVYARYAAEEGLSAATLTPLQGQKARLKYPPPRNIGGAGTGV